MSLSVQALREEGGVASLRKNCDEHTKSKPCATHDALHKRYVIKRQTENTWEKKPRVLNGLQEESKEHLSVASRSAPTCGVWVGIPEKGGEEVIKKSFNRRAFASFCAPFWRAFASFFRVRSRE